MGKSKDDAIKVIQESDSTEFEVFTVEDHKTFLENYEKDAVDKKLKDRVSEIHQQYDNDLYEITGKRKAPNQKTYNFLKEIISDLQESAKNAPELQKTIDELKESIKNGAGSEQIKKDLESIQKQFADSKKEWDEEKSKLITSQQRMQLDNELDKAMVGLKFKDSIPENVRAVMVRTVKDNLINSAKIVDGQLIFIDKEGATLRNQENALNPFTAEEMLKDQLKDILGEERKITGTGVKPEIKGEGDKKDIVVGIPDNVRTKQMLSEHLLALGLTRDSDEYKLAYAKYSEKLPYK